MFILIGIVVTAIWVLIKAAGSGYPEPLIIIALAVVAEVLWNAVIRPLGSFLFSGSFDEIGPSGSAVQANGKPPIDWEEFQEHEAPEDQEEKRE